MKGIKMSDCKFYVNEEERTIVCVIPYTTTMLWDFIWDNFNWSDVNISDAIDRHFVKEINMPGSFIGKAVCADEDEWNEEVGRMIAFSRAKDKCYKSFFRRANLLVQTIDRRLGDMITTFNDFGVKLEDKREALQAQIDEKIQK